MGSLHHSDIATEHPINLTISNSPDDHLNNMNVQLHKAAKAGNVNDFDTALQKFSKQNNMPTFTIFNQSTLLKNTLIHVAASFNNPNLVQHLLNKHPNFLNQVNYKGDTALHIAAREGHLEVVKALNSFKDEELEINGASNSLVNEEGNTPLHEAMIHRRHTVVDYFLGISEYSGFYVNNKEGMSPLYLAVESGKVKNVKIMLQSGLSRLDQKVFFDQITRGKSLTHAAIAGKSLVLLREIANTNRALINFKDEKQQNALHCAASVGFLDGVKYLLNEFDMDAFEKDKDGFCPIHLAFENGHVNIILHFLQLYPDAREFLNRKRQNILHVAAENGKDVAVRSILRSPESELLLNERDEDGNTCLHLATRKWHPKVVSSLTWDKRVNPKLVNKAGLTALEVAETSMEVMAPFRQRLTWMALMSAGAERAKVRDMATINRLKAAKYEPYSMDYCKDRVNTLLLVSALVATITFAAGFAMPGTGSNNTSNAMPGTGSNNISNAMPGTGSNNTSNANQATAIMLHNLNLIVFMLCDFLAFCSSITVVVILMWAQLGDLNLLLNALRQAQMCLGFSLTMTTVAFMVGIHLLLAKLFWLGVVVLTLGILSVASLLALFVPLFLPYTSNFRIARYISYYPFYLLMMASESYA